MYVVTRCHLNNVAQLSHYITFDYLLVIPWLSIPHCFKLQYQKHFLLPAENISGILKDQAHSIQSRFLILWQYHTSYPPWIGKFLLARKNPCSLNLPLLPILYFQVSMPPYVRMNAVAVSTQAPINIGLWKGRKSASSFSPYMILQISASLLIKFSVSHNYFLSLVFVLKFILDGTCYTLPISPIFSSRSLLCLDHYPVIIFFSAIYVVSKTYLSYPHILRLSPQLRNHLYSNGVSWRKPR